jgi:hypothetical protein
MNAVMVNKDLVAYKIITTDASILSGRHNCAAIYLNSVVMQEDQELGRIIFEPYTLVANTRVVSLNGQESLSLGFRRSEPGLK